MRSLRPWVLSAPGVQLLYNPGGYSQIYSKSARGLQGPGFSVPHCTQDDLAFQEFGAKFFWFWLVVS